MSGVFVTTVDLREPTGAADPKVMLHGVNGAAGPVVAMNALGHGKALVYIRADEWERIDKAARTIFGGAP